MTFCFVIGVYLIAKNESTVYRFKSLWDIFEKQRCVVYFMVLTGNYFKFYCIFDLENQIK